MAEHLVYTERVGGSSPSPPTVSLALAALLLFGQASAQTPPGRCVEPRPSPEGPGWYELFDGKTLSGWRGNNDLFAVENGAIVAFRRAPFDFGYLFYVGCLNGAVFRDFELKADIVQEPNSNSGVVFHTEWQIKNFLEKGQQVQVATDPGQARRTGSLYHLQDVLKGDAAKPGEPYTLHILVQGKRVQVRVDGRKLVDYVEPDEMKLSWERRRLSSGGFALEAHGGRTYYRSVRVRPLP